MSRLIPPLLPLALAVLGGCGAFEPPPEREPPPDLTLARVQLEHYDEGRLTQRAFLDSARYHRTDGRADGTAIEVEPLDDDGRPAGRLIAARGNGVLRDGEVGLEGGVRHRTPDGEVLTTEACRVDLRARTARGVQPVRMEGDGYVLDGAGFQAGWSEPAWFRFDGPVHAVQDDAAGEASP